MFAYIFKLLKESGPNLAWTFPGLWKCPPHTFWGVPLPGEHLGKITFLETVIYCFDFLIKFKFIGINGDKSPVLGGKSLKQAETNKLGGHFNLNIKGWKWTKLGKQGKFCFTGSGSASNTEIICFFFQDVVQNCFVLLLCICTLYVSQYKITWRYYSF